MITAVGLRRRASADRCRFCGGPGVRTFVATDRNRETTAERFCYARCRWCHTLFLEDPPPDLGRYYGSGYYGFDPDGEPSWKRDPERMRAAAYRVELLLDQLAPGHLIEVGSGTGAFAVAAKQAGFDVSAIEMSERCCDYLRERAGISATCTDRPLEALESLPQADVVALWHVLEHLDRPAEMIERAASKLAPGGILALAVPNPRSLQCRLLRARWAHLDAPRHLGLVPARALIEKGRTVGLSCVGQTTTDPDGLACNLFGWINALQPRPATGAIPPLRGHIATNLCRVLAPLERTGDRGAAITLLLRRAS